MKDNLIYQIFTEHYESTKKDPQSIIMQKAGDKRLKSPLFVTWEITSQCNLQCKHCRAAYNNSRNIEIQRDFNNYKEILDELDSLEIYTLGITGGEPFLHPDFWDILSESRKHSYNIILYTNATFIVEESAKKLSQLLHKDDIIHISLDGGTREANDAQRGDGVFEKVVNALEILRTYNVPVRLNIVPTIFNVTSIPQLCDIALKMHVKEFGASPIMLMGRAQKELIPQQDVLFEMEKTVHSKLINTSTKYIGGISGPVSSYLDMQDWDNSYDLNRECLIYKRCDAGNRKIFIDAFGDVYPCSLFATNKNFIIGNVFSSSIKKIWNSEKARTICHGKKITSKKCLECKLLSLCNGGCMALALNYYNDLGEIDPRCNLAD